MKNQIRASLIAALCLSCATLLAAQTVIKSDWPKDKIPADVSVFRLRGRDRPRSLRRRLLDQGSRRQRPRTWPSTSPS